MAATASLSGLSNTAAGERLRDHGNPRRNVPQRAIVGLPRPLRRDDGDGLNGFSGARHLAGCWQRRPILQ
jgi:hypothetical protein